MSKGSSSIWCARSTTVMRKPARTIRALEARIQSFELAYRMQDEAAEAFDIES